MRRFVPLLIAGAVLIAAACSDPAAPSRPTSATMQSFGRATDASLVLSDLTSRTYTFVLEPSGGSVKIAGFRLDYTANAVCDPATSGYGPEYWLADCVTLSAPLTMTAKVTVVDGRSSIDFSPDIRFRPTATVNLGVRRSLLVGAQISDDLTQTYSILYFRDVNGARQYFDEAATDGEMVTHAENGQGKVWRRIRHFSGYYVRSGDKCDESDPSCTGGGLY